MSGKRIKQLGIDDHELGAIARGPTTTINATIATKIIAANFDKAASQSSCLNMGANKAYMSEIRERQLVAILLPKQTNWSAMNDCQILPSPVGIGNRGESAHTATVNNVAFFAIARTARNNDNDLACITAGQETVVNTGPFNIERGAYVYGRCQDEKNLGMGMEDAPPDQIFWATVPGRTGDRLPFNQFRQLCSPGGALYARQNPDAKQRYDAFARLFQMVSVWSVSNALRQGWIQPTDTFLDDGGRKPIRTDFTERKSAAYQKTMEKFAKILAQEPKEDEDITESELGVFTSDGKKMHFQEMLMQAFCLEDTRFSVFMHDKRYAETNAPKYSNEFHSEMTQYQASALRRVFEAEQLIRVNEEKCLLGMALSNAAPGEAMNLMIFARGSN